MGWFRDEVELRVRLAALWVRRHPWGAAVLALVLVLVIAAIGEDNGEEPDPRPAATRSAPATTETEFEVDPGQLRRLAMLSGWQQESPAARAQYCEAYHLLGAETSYQNFLVGWGDNPPTLSEFRSFFDDRC
jgi:hypothetical protein